MTQNRFAIGLLVCGAAMLACGAPPRGGAGASAARVLRGNASRLYKLGLK